MGRARVRSPPFRSLEKPARSGAHGLSQSVTSFCNSQWFVIAASRQSTAQSYTSASFPRRWRDTTTELPSQRGNAIPALSPRPVAASRIAFAT
jgi:hypothetical protein